MSPQVVIRRFEVHGAERDLDAIRDALSTVAYPFTERAELKVDITRHRSPVASVQLTGSGPAASAVRASIATTPGVRVVNDWLDAPAAPEPGELYVYPDQRALQMIGAGDCIGDEAGSGKRVIVAIIDSGITIDHPDLAEHLWTDERDPRVHGARFMDGQQDSDVSDQDGHGTMLAGTILATANRVRGLELMAVKFFDVTTQPSAANAAAAIRFAASKRPAVINLSFDLGIGSSDLGDAIRAACASGALIVIAAGNTGSNNDKYPLVPARYADECRDQVIVVMATDWYDRKPIFSNFGGASVDLAAPGVGIVSTRAPIARGPEARKYGRYSGTSAAAAHVSGAAALLKSQDPRRTPQEIKRLLMDSVDQSPWLTCASSGRLNLSRAVSPERVS